MRYCALLRRSVIAILTLTAIMGCNRHGEESANHTAGRARIALIMKSLANEFFQTMEHGAREHQRAHSGDYELIANGIKDEQDVARQVQIVDQMIAQKVDAVVIAPAD